MPLGKLWGFLYTLFLENEEQASEKNYGAMFFNWNWGRMRKCSYFGTRNKNKQNGQLSLFSTIWKHFCQRIWKRHVRPIILLFDVMNLSNFLLMSILMCIIYWKLQQCMEYQLKANNHLSGHLWEKIVLSKNRTQLWFPTRAKLKLPNPESWAHWKPLDHSLHV